MELDAILSAVSTVGFPIVMCLIMLRYLKEERQSHKEEMNALRESLDKNTIAITELREAIKDEN